MSRSPLLPHRAPQPSPLPVERPLPEEVPLALVYNGSTLAVMMGTPEDLEDFATGFSLSEGIVTGPAELGEIEVLRHPSGIELRMWLPNNQAHKLAARRRAVTGPVGCGLCGIDSLDQALRQPPPLPDDRLHLTQADLTAAMEGLRACQPLHDETRAVHAAGFYIPGRGIVAAREDVAIIYPVHPNPNVTGVMREALSDCENIALIEPLDYLNFVAMMEASTVMLTDSGGIQEEAPSLGKPVLVMRGTALARRLVAAGTSLLVGADAARIVAETNRLLDDPAAYDAMARAHNPYGDGAASQRIAQIIASVHD